MEPLGVQEVIAALHRAPLLTIEETRAALAAEPDAHGFYSWWLIDPEALPGVPTSPHPTEPVGLLYIGVAPGKVTSERSLSERFVDHTRESGRSTLRYALASFLYDQAAWKLRWRGKPLVAKPDDRKLTTWMQNNLRVQWVGRPKPLEIEAAVVRVMLPPLNRDHNQAHPFYETVGKSRQRFREAALAAHQRT